jgi:hypothetical protein
MFGRNGYLEIEDRGDMYQGIERPEVAGRQDQALALREKLLESFQSNNVDRCADLLIAERVAAEKIEVVLRQVAENLSRCGSDSGLVPLVLQDIG